MVKIASLKREVSYRLNPTKSYFCAFIEKMKLIIDVGNTLVKLGVFEGEELKLRKTLIKKDFLNTLADIYETWPQIKDAIVASVGRLTQHQSAKLLQRYKVLVLDQKTPVPFINKYSTPNTLGVDRIALVSAAAQQYMGKNVLIIDAGTCITYDFLNDRNEYLGGAISPGISMRYMALHKYTAKLPLLEPKKPKSMTGDSTNSSLHSGVVQGTLFEVDGFIDSYKNKFGNLTVILTGGDAHFLRDSLKNDIFANQNFLLEGLNHILEYNTA